MPAGKLALVTKGTKQFHPRKKQKELKITLKRPHRMNLINSNKLSPFGQKKTGVFRYTQQINIPSGIAPGVHSFRINSMFDPDFTGGGHQPLFRDVMSGIYARYRVDKITYKVTNLNNTYLLLMGILATQDTGYNPVMDQFQQIIEKRNTQWRIQGSGAEPVSLSGVLQCHKVAGVTKKAYTDERSYSAAVGTNPSLPLFLTVFAQDVGSASRNTDFMVELNYHTTYYEPIVQAQN